MNVLRGSIVRDAGGVNNEEVGPVVTALTSDRQYATLPDQHNFDSFHIEVADPEFESGSIVPTAVTYNKFSSRDRISPAIQEFS